MRLTVYATAGTSTHTVRPSVVTTFIELWSGGGNGAGVIGTGSAGGGGAGGNYAASLLTVTPGAGYSVVRGAAGVGSSWNTSTVIAVAPLGALAVTDGAAAGAGADSYSTGSVGDVVLAGGAGGTAPSATSSGAGGAAATAAGAGQAASGNTIGTGVSPAGSGGAGRTTAGAGNAGSTFGGGGGGAYASNTIDRAAGAGGAGGAYIWELDQSDLLLLGCG